MNWSHRLAPDRCTPSMRRPSILFVRPDYHCTFFHRDELRRLGWKADIFVDANYPEKLLYCDRDILRIPSTPVTRPYHRYLNAFRGVAFYISVFWRYKYHFYYGGFDAFSFQERRLGLTRLFGESFRVHLWLAKVFRRKIVRLPTGCREEETRENFSKLDLGNVCNNCGWGAACNDTVNEADFDIIRRYADMVIGTGSIDSTQYRMTHLRYKSIDLALWKPELEIPEEFKLPSNGKIRILHSFYKAGREEGGRNIKGSPFIVGAIDRLKNEGHEVEYMFVSDVPSRHMRYYQAQADIVVEQLIYGWWGSTLVEAAALGKPVVCYLRPSWKARFFKTFPEYSELPVVEATTTNIYDVLKRLVTDHEFRENRGRAARRFAEQHFDPARNAPALAELLSRL
jgi:hypothetical protein